MPRLNMSPAPQPVSSESEDMAKDISPVSLVTDPSQMKAMSSPAIEMQDALRQTLENASGAYGTRSRDLDGQKIPFGWSLLGLVTLSGLVWAGVWTILS